MATFYSFLPMKENFHFKTANERKLPKTFICKIPMKGFFHSLSQTLSRPSPLPPPQPPPHNKVPDTFFL
jgi:hypothetical protein